MARPNSAVELCNLSLDLLKESPIASFSNPNDKVSALCNRWFDLKRRGFLQAYNWNFALKSASIPRGGAPSVSDYPDYYVFPNNYLKLRAIADPQKSLEGRDYEIQGRNLLYDNGGGSSLDIWYTCDETDYSLWSDLALLMFVHGFALTLGKKLTVRKSIMDDIRTDFAELKLQARSADGQIRPPKRYESSKIVNAGISISSPHQVAGDYEFDFEAN